MPSNWHRTVFAFSVRGREVRLRLYKWTMTTRSPDAPRSVDSSVVGATIDLDGPKHAWVDSWNIFATHRRRRY